MCLCDNIGLVALILLGWELRASSITVLCVQAVMILSPLLFMPSLYSHSNSNNFYTTCIHSTTVLCDNFVHVHAVTHMFLEERILKHDSGQLRPNQYLSRSRSDQLCITQYGSTVYIGMAMGCSAL